MCGAAGLFVGCSTPPLSCPLSALKPKEERAGRLQHSGDRRYVSAFKHWDTKSSVRSSPERIEGASLGTGILFPDELVPVLSHEYFREEGEQFRERIRLAHLERYLKFTLALETDAVNPVIMNVARARDGLSLPPEMRQDAFRMYVDEAYHANFTYALLRRLEQERGVSADLTETPYFLQRIAKIARRAPAEMQHHLMTLFVSISELLITGTLNALPKYEGVAEPVRNSVQDHAADEARHHAFFSAYLPIYWESLSAREKHILGPLVPDLIDCFLQPDLPSLKAELGRYGIPEETTQTILAEIYSLEKTSDDRKRMARPVLKVMDRAGICDVPAITHRLETLGLAQSAQVNGRSGQFV